MNCRRCKGLVIQDLCFNVIDGCGVLPVARCVVCGDVTDPVILTNRTGQQIGPLKRSARGAVIDRPRSLVSAARVAVPGAVRQPGRHSS
jgi:hypothetical protein